MAPTKVHFIEPMLLAPADRLAEGPHIAYELKLDGFRAQAIKTNGRAALRSRNNKNFAGKYPEVMKALAAMPDETVIDGEIVALDPAGKPSFGALQDGSDVAHVVLYVFDVMILEGRDVMGETLSARRASWTRLSRT